MKQSFSDFFREHRFAVSLLLSTFFVVLSVSFTGLERFVALVSAANPYMLLLGFIAANIPVIVYSVVWKNCLSISGKNFGFGRTLRLWFAATFVNNVTPLGHVGGEPLVAKTVADSTGSTTEETLSTLVVADTINFLPMLTFLVAGMVYTGFSPLHHFTVFEMVAVLTSVLLSVYFIVFRSPGIYGFLERIVDQVEKGLGVNIDLDKRVSGFHEGLKKMFVSPGSLLLMFLFAHIGVFFDILSIQLISLAFQDRIVIPYLMFLVPAARLANYTPSPGGSGFYEAAMSGLLVTVAGFELSVAVSVAVTYRIMTYYTGTLLGYIAFNMESYSYRIRN